MFFRDIIGQDDIKRQLIHSVKSGRIAHAQLFTGNEGVGKFPLALAYARYIQCTDRHDDDACGKCPSCKKYNTLLHPDLHFVFPIVKKGSKETVCDDYIAQWRAFVCEDGYFNLGQWLSFIGAGNAQAMIYAKESDEIIRKLNLKTYESDYKVMIVWLPERMNETCANKLLKIIEEPYENTVLLLVSDEPDKILSTILSRSQQIQVRSIPHEIIARELVNRYGLDDQDAVAVSHTSEGSFVKAVESIRLSEENSLFFDLFVRLMRLAYGRKIKNLKEWTDEVAELGRERQRKLLEYSQRMLRENFIYNLAIPQINYLNRQEAEFSSRFAPFITEWNVYPLMEELGKAESDIAQNANAKIVFFDLCIKVIMLLKK